MTETETDTRQVDCVLGEYMIWNWIKHEKKKKKNVLNSYDTIICKCSETSFFREWLHILQNYSYWLSDEKTDITVMSLWLIQAGARRQLA